MNSKRIVLTSCMLIIVFALGIYAYTTSSARNRMDPESTRQTDANPAAEVSLDDNWDTETKIGQIVADRPQTARIFDLAGIDYCCGGETFLGVAAKEMGIDPATLLNALSVVGTSAQVHGQRDWQQAEIGDLIDHIVARHHRWLRRELPAISKITSTVIDAHADNHPELTEIGVIVDRILETLIPHLDEEEKHVFPSVRELVEGNPSADVETMLEEMRTEHDALGADLNRIRVLTDGFSVPQDACTKYREMLSSLESLESDMHTHVHLENNVLLPRAMQLLEASRPN